MIQQTAAALAAANPARVFVALFGAVRAVPPYIMLPLYRTVFVCTWISASPARHLAELFSVLPDNFTQVTVNTGAGSPGY